MTSRGPNRKLEILQIMRRWEVISNLVTIAVCAVMWFATAKQVRADESSRLAVLQTRADQIDTHLKTTDASVDRLWVTVENQGLQLSGMQGEERAAFAFLGLITTGNFIVQIRRRKDP